MTKISDKYIKQAMSIRTDFLMLTPQLDLVLDKLSDVTKTLKSKNDELAKINDNLANYEKEVAENLIQSKLSELSLISDKLFVTYKGISDKIEQLTIAEEALYDSITTTYGNLSDEEIRGQLKPYLEKIK